MSTPNKTAPAVDLPRLVLRLQQTRKFANAWKRLNDSGDIPKYFNATRGPVIWEVYKRIAARAEKARLNHSAALKEWVDARRAQNSDVEAFPLEPE